MKGLYAGLISLSLLGSPGCGHKDTVGSQTIPESMRSMSDQWKSKGAFLAFSGLKDLVQKDATPEYVQDVLGKPLEVASKNGKQSWRYVRAENRPGAELSWWLTFGPDGRSAGWLAEATEKKE